jgi:hypothetical protein
MIAWFPFYHILFVPLALLPRIIRIIPFCSSQLHSALFFRLMFRISPSSSFVHRFLFPIYRNIFLLYLCFALRYLWRLSPSDWPSTMTPTTPSPTAGAGVLNISSSYLNDLCSYLSEACISFQSTSLHCKGLRQLIPLYSCSIVVSALRLLLWSSGQSSWLQSRDWGSIPGATRFFWEEVVWKRSTQPRDYNWGAIWKNK